MAKHVHVWITELGDADYSREDHAMDLIESVDPDDELIGATWIGDPVVDLWVRETEFGVTGDVGDLHRELRQQELPYHIEEER